ncbi:MAG: S53 family peptidase [Steroidobacteraceae bacterium]
MRNTFSIKPLIAGVAAATLGVLSALSSLCADAHPTIRIGGQVTQKGEQLPSNAYCVANYGFQCLGPSDIRTAYGLNPLLNAGYNGAGETIVLIESYGSPTLAADLQQFDADFAIPDPPSLIVLAPLGTATVDMTQPDQQGWAFETSLDVEWAHAIAPGAAIIVLTSPVDETEGVQGLPEFLALEEYALDHHLGHIISQSWAATENTLFPKAAGLRGPLVIAGFSAFYERARLERITIFASTGDDGSENAATYDSTLGVPTSFYTFPTVNFPASSPLVTAVGGTTLNLNAASQYQSETVWNDNSIGAGAGGGGVSQVFPIPDYQLGLPFRARSILGGHRGIPDVSYNADDANSAIFVYTSFLGAVYGPGAVGYYLIGGTSEGSPQWAGIVADLNQYGHAPLGFLNPRLYALGTSGLFPVFGHDVTQGNNSYGGVAGYNATVGWDPATGWGTPKFDLLPQKWGQFNQ